MMIKHLKIFARGLRELWFVWVFLAYFIVAITIGDMAGFIMVMLPVVGIICVGVYAIGKGVSND